jgi:branched-chain amino acid transport system permease protein
VTTSAPSTTSGASTARSTRNDAAPFLVMTALFAVAPLAVYPFFMMQALCFALFACAFNLLIGYVGLLSFGHAMFLGTGGYLSAHAARVWGLSPELSILCGVAGSTVLGAVTGALAIRRQGIYFAMITLALSQMIYFFFLEAPFTHGEDGIQGVPQGKLLGLVPLSNPWALYYFVLAVFLFGFLVVYRTVNSPFGEVLKAIRENEPRAVSLGYRVDRYKLAAFVLSAALSGLAGGTKAIVAQNASLTDVHYLMSGEVVLMTLLGGMGTIYGPVVGALILVAMQNYLAQYGQWVTIIQGAIFIVCVLLFRRGVVGEIAHRFKLSL